MKKLFSFGPLLIVIAAFLWAMDGVLRRTLYSIPPLTIVFLEHAVGTVILLPYMISQWPQIKILKRKEIVNLAWIALFSGVLGTLWFTTALLKVNFISFSVVFLLQKMQPLFVIIAAALILKERITKQYIYWAGLALVAAFFVTFKNGVVNFATGAGTIEAAIYALLAAFAWGTSTVFSKIALQTKSDLLVTSLRFVIATFIAGVAILALTQEHTVFAVTLSQLFRFVVIALSTGMVALAIYYRGLANTEAKVATILELVFPVTAVIIDAIVYKSFLAPTQLLAAGVLLLSAYKLGKLRSERAQFVSKKITGKGRGKKMGVPTINLEIPKNLDLREGIYAAYVSFNGHTYHGALHYGPIPTFDEKQLSLEVFLLNVKEISEGVVKRSTITVDIVQYLRPVMHFPNTQEMVKQIDLDVNRVKSIL